MESHDPTQKFSASNLDIPYIRWKMKKCCNLGENEYGIKRSNAKWIGRILRSNYLIKHIKLKKLNRRGVRRRKQLLDDLKEMRRYCKIKEEALDHNLFGTGYGPVLSLRHGDVQRAWHWISWSWWRYRWWTGTVVLYPEDGDSRLFRDADKFLPV